MLEAGQEVLALCRNPDRVNWPAVESGTLRTESVDIGDRELLTSILNDFGATKAYYLIHSMGGGVEDRHEFVQTDDRLARAFAQSVSASRVDHVVYLGGHVPNGEVRSAHLESRSHVAEIFRASIEAVTELRAGVVIDLDSAAFRMLSAIIEKQSTLLIPPQFRNFSHPIALDDAVQTLLASLELAPDWRNATYDIGCAEPCRYADLIKWYGEARGVDSAHIPIPWAPRALIVPYVAGLTGEDFGLVWALSGSWGVDLPLHDERLYERLPNLPRTPAQQAVVQAVEGRRTQIQPSRATKAAS